MPTFIAAQHLKHIPSAKTNKNTYEMDLSPRKDDELDFSFLSDFSREDLYRFQSAFRYPNVTFESVLPLVTSPDVLSRLQDSKLDGGEKNINFQLRGPHFLTFLRYVQHNLDRHDSLLSNCIRDRFTDLMMCIDGCLLYGERENYRKFLEFILYIMPDFKEFFQVLPKQQQLSYFYCEYEIVVTFLNFVLETIGELLNCRTYFSVVVSDQVKVLPKELDFLVIFFVDTILHNMEEHNMNIFTEIEAVFNELGLLLHSFFFTAELVTATKMDRTVLVLLERIRIVQVKIKDECIVVSKKLSSGIGSLQVAETSSQDKSISMVEEIIVGFENMTKQIASHLREGKRCLQIISIVGMPGLGKTTLAKKIYNEFKLSSHFDTLSWCVVSQTYKKRKLLIDILSFVSNLKGDEILEKEDEDLALCLYRNLIGRRYLIVMDDLWDTEVWDDLKKLFPGNDNGSRILFTSRLKSVASETSHFIIEPPPLSQGECWDLLEKKVFVKEFCPQELQDIGKKIAANCKGLPLLVVVIASVLSNMEKKSLWRHVAISMSSYISEKA